MDKTQKQPVTVTNEYNKYVGYDESGNYVETESYNNERYKKKYNKLGQLIYYEDRRGYIGITKYDENGNKLGYEDNEGYRYKTEYNKEGEIISYEDSNGNWYKKIYNGKKLHKIIYFEKSIGEVKIIEKEK